MNRPSDPPLCRSLLLSAFLAAASLSLGGCSQAPTDAESRIQAADAFTHFRRDYLLDYWSHHPVEATQAGQTQYASRLPALSTEDIQHQINQINGHLEWLASTPESIMFDSRLQAARNQLEAHARERLLLLQFARRWERDPRLYLAEPAFLQLEDPSLGSAEQRAGWLLARLDQLPVLLATGLSNLDQPPQRFTVDALRSIDRLEGSLLVLAEQLADETPELEYGLRMSLTRASESLADYRNSLRTNILPSSEDYAGVGSLVYARFLTEVHGVSLSVEDWLAQSAEQWELANGQAGVSDEEKKYRALVWLDARIHSREFSADGARHFLIDELGMSHPDTAQEVDNLLQYPARILSRPPANDRQGTSRPVSAVVEP